jgi:hypothetical protein
MPNVELPPLNTDSGIIARMLINEVRGPGYSSYDADLSKKSMRVIKKEVENRLTKPNFFNASGATNAIGIITAPGQYDGFSKNSAGNIVISQSVQNNIDSIVAKANSGPPGPYAQFVQNCIDVANGTISSLDPFANITNIGGQSVEGDVYGHRTAGSSHPGGSFVAIPDNDGHATDGVFNNQQFYTLKTP